MQSVLRGWAALAVALLSACGGGGGGETGLSLSLPISRVETSTVARRFTQVEVFVRIAGLEDPQIVFVGASGVQAPPRGSAA